MSLGGVALQGAVRDAMAFLNCSIAVARSIFSSLISALIDVNSAAYAFGWVVAVDKLAAFTASGGYSAGLSKS